MIQDLTLDVPLRVDAGGVEFSGSLDGKQQAFRVDASVFRDMLQVRHIDETSMKNLFLADPEHFCSSRRASSPRRVRAARRSS